MTVQHLRNTSLTYILRPFSTCLHSATIDTPHNRNSYISPDPWNCHDNDKYISQSLTNGYSQTCREDPRILGPGPGPLELFMYTNTFALELKELKDPVLKSTTILQYRPVDGRTLSESFVVL
jgi:hypothetical protein